MHNGETATFILLGCSPGTREGTIVTFIPRLKIRPSLLCSNGSSNTGYGWSQEWPSDRSNLSQGLTGWPWLP